MDILTSRRVRGRPRSDLSGLVRNSLWASVAYETQHSWDGLDRDLLPLIDSGTPTEDQVPPDPRGRRRVFHRICREGHDPSRIRGKNGKILLIEVNKLPRMLHARMAWNSAFWELAGPNPRSDAWIEQTFRGLLDRLNLYHATLRDLSVARLLKQESRHLGIAGDPETEAYTIFDSEVVRRHALEVAMIPSIDALAVLCCAFRVAISRLALEEAMAFMKGIQRSLEVLKSRWRTARKTIELVGLLVDLRILRRDYREIDMGLDGCRLRQRGKPKHKGYAGIPLVGLRDYCYPDCMPPVVRRDAFLEEFLTELPMERERFIAQRMRLYADASRKDGYPPPGDDNAIRRMAERSVDEDASPWPF